MKKCPFVVYAPGTDLTYCGPNPSLTHSECKGKTSWLTPCPHYEEANNRDLVNQMHHRDHFINHKELS